MSFAKASVNLPSQTSLGNIKIQSDSEQFIRFWSLNVNTLKDEQDMVAWYQVAAISFFHKHVQ